MIGFRGDTNLGPGGQTGPGCGGYVLMDPAQKYHEPASTVELTAVPHAGFEFVRWEDETAIIDPPILQNPLPVFMYADRSITAVFRRALQLSPPVVLPTLPQADLSLFDPAWQNQTVDVNLYVADVVLGLTFRAEHVPGTGGHQESHHTPAACTDTGSFTSTTPQPSGLPGCYFYSTTYMPSAFSGIFNIIAQSSRGEENWTTQLEVRVPGLSKLGDGVNYELIGGTDAHPGNHWMRVYTNTRLVNIANAYRIQFPDGSIQINYNDASLQFGGRFDINGAWTGSHNRHRLGLHVDVRSWSIEHPTGFIGFIQSNDGVVLLDQEPPHYHLSFSESGT